MGCKRECFYGMGNICCIECPRYHSLECTDYCDELDAYTFTVNCPDYVKEETGGKVMDNYLVLNGKRINLTEEQVKTLVGEEKKDDPFRKPNIEKYFYFIDVDGSIAADTWNNTNIDEDYYKCGNCCLIEDIMEHRALEETLSRLLWRFSMQNDGDKIDWNAGCQEKWYIYYIYDEKKFGVESNFRYKSMTSCYFSSRGLAQRAIDEIIIPYAKEHPELGYEVEEQIEIPPLDINDAEDLDNEYEIKMED